MYITKLYNGESLDNPAYGDDFIKKPKVQSVKEIIDKLDLPIIENFCFGKDNVKKVKTIHRLTENICKRHLTKNGSKLYVTLFLWWLRW